MHIETQNDQKALSEDWTIAVFLTLVYFLKQKNNHIVLIIVLIVADISELCRTITFEEI